MTPGHLVADRQHPLDGHIDLDHLQDTAREFVAMLDSFGSTICLLLNVDDPGPKPLDNAFDLAPSGGWLDPFQVKVLDLFIDHLIIAAGTHLLAC